MYDRYIIPFVTIHKWKIIFYPEFIRYLPTAYLDNLNTLTELAVLVYILKHQASMIMKTECT